MANMWHHVFHKRTTEIISAQLVVFTGLLWLGRMA
jgi:hypothetical protein